VGGRLLSTPRRFFRGRTDLLHLHGAFVPELALVARRAGLPYVVTPHGGCMQASGVPLVVSRDCDLAGSIEESGAGLVVDVRQETAASQVAAFLDDDDALREASEAGRAWAHVALSPETVGAEAVSMGKRWSDDEWLSEL
jgi:hypothetical protein